MTSLETQKQLLIMESEINRDLLGREWEAITDKCRALSVQAKSVRLYAIVGVLVVTGLVVYRLRKNVAASGKSSWLSAFINGVRLASSI